MVHFKTKIKGYDQEFNFECYENTHPIEIGDKYIFFVWGMAVVMSCQSDQEMYEINKNDRIRNPDKIDLVTGFWKNCYKIKSTDFDLSLID